jgi:hypothetical protein
MKSTDVSDSMVEIKIRPNRGVIFGKKYYFKQAHARPVPLDYQITPQHLDTHPPRRL